VATLKKSYMKVRLCTVPFNLYITNLVRMHFVDHSSIPCSNKILLSTLKDS